MTVLIYSLVAVLVVAQGNAEVLDLSCSDNATCIESLARQLVRGLRQQRAVRLFETVLIEPVAGQRQARSNQGALAKFLSTHALSFDLGDYSLRLSKPASRSGVMEMEVFSGRAVEEVEEEPTVTKKGSEEKEEGKPKRRIIRRRHSKRIIQALLPMLLGMKSAGTAILAISAVAVLTLKAFVASKLALLVTVGMAAKRLYESFGQGVGLQNHPYLYSQYPIDFPSASSHAYSVSGVSNPQFASPELFGATALASHSHQHEMLQQSDASAQQSQSAPTVQLANATRASERWDGKSRLLGMLKHAVDTVKSALQPIAGKIVDVMPATFRTITSKAFGLEVKQKEEELEDFIESRIPKGIHIDAPINKAPKQILIPKPRLLSRKSSEIKANRHSKVPSKKVFYQTMDIRKLKENKDLSDYIKIKKYNYNYANTHYYPRMKHFIGQSQYLVFGKDTLPAPTQKIIQINPIDKTKDVKTVSDVRELFNINKPPKLSSTRFSDFVPRKRFNVIDSQSMNSRQKREVNIKPEIESNEDTYLNGSREINLKINRRKSALNGNYLGRGITDLLFNTNPVDALLKQVDDYVKSHNHTKKPHKMPLVTTSQKVYYVGVEMVTFGLQMFDVYLNMADSILNHLTGEEIKKKKIHKRKGNSYYEKKSNSKTIKNKAYSKINKKAKIY